MRNQVGSPAQRPQMIGWATLNNCPNGNICGTQRKTIEEFHQSLRFVLYCMNSAHRPRIRAAAATDLYNGQIRFNFRLFAHIPTFLPHVFIPSACRAISQSITLTWLHLFNRKSLFCLSVLYRQTNRWKEKALRSPNNCLCFWS